MFREDSYINIKNIQKDVLKSLLISNDYESFHHFKIGEFKLNIQINNFSNRGHIYLFENKQPIKDSDKRFKSFRTTSFPHQIIINFSNVEELYNIVNYINRLENLSLFS